MERIIIVKSYDIRQEANANISEVANLLNNCSVRKVLYLHVIVADTTLVFSTAETVNDVGLWTGTRCKPGPESVAALSRMSIVKGLPKSTG